MGFCHPAASLSPSLSFLSFGGEDTKFSVHFRCLAGQIDVKLVDIGSLSVPRPTVPMPPTQQQWPTYISHMILLNMLAGAAIVGNKDRCLTSLFVQHFKKFCGCLLSKDMYISSLPLPLPVSLSLLSLVWDCLETCRFWHMLLPENVSPPAALLGPLITCKKNNNKLGRCLLFQLINWQWFHYNWRQKARKLPVGAQWGIHIFLLSHVNPLERRIYKRLRLPANYMFFIPGLEISESQCRALSHI